MSEYFTLKEKKASLNFRSKSCTTEEANSREIVCMLIVKNENYKRKKNENYINIIIFQLYMLKRYINKQEALRLKDFRH